MADAIVSAVAERIIAMLEEQIRNGINLVRGVEEEARQLSQELMSLRIVLNNAENRRFKDDNVNYWLSRLEQTSYEMEDVLDEWNYALLKHKMDQSNDASPKQKVCSFIPSSSCLCFNRVVVRLDIAKKIRNVKQRLDQILKEKDQYNFITSQPTTDPSPESWRVQSTSLIDLGNVQGRDQDKDILVSKLMGKLGNVQVVSIVGVGGLGKTTLAQMVYNDSRVKGCFELRIWICVSDPFNLSAIAKGILDSLGMGSSSNTNQLDVLFKHIQDSISGKRFLIVLDDVWTEDHNKWEPLEKTLRCGGVGSKILVTTRNEKVARIMGTMHDDIHHPGQLSDKDCWLVMRRMAFLGKNYEVSENFEDIGEKIAKKCKGLPLAAKTLGSLLCFKNTLKDWEDVLKSEIWEMKEAKVDLFPHLLLTYNELSPTLKCCFSYCGVFLKDQVIDVDELIRYWMALGYLGSEGNMEGRGREYFDILAMHSLFQDFEKDDMDGTIQLCKMHDIVHDFAQFVRKNGRLEGITMNKTTCTACDPELVSTVNEFCSLFLKDKNFSLKPCDCLTRLRVLSVQGCCLEEISKGIGNLIHLRHLNLSYIENLKELSGKIGNLIHLNHLCLCWNENLKELPREIGNLIHLNRLYLSKNKNLKELPREIGNLIHLNHLDLCWNENMKELPREIGNLIHLNHLDLSGNKNLKELPREIGNLIHLNRLYLSKNKNLKELPREIGNLIHLNHLDLCWNENMKELPREIGNLIHLNHLDLSGNKNLKELPREIGNLIHLNHLDLSWNKNLKELPREIGNLIHLNHLDLSWNENLKELPENICALINLRTLDISGCYDLSKLPEGVGELISLRTLPLFKGGSGGNKLGSLKKLNNLSGSLELRIRLDMDINSEEMEEDAEEAQLRNKIELQYLEIWFEDEMENDESSSMMRMKVLDVLEPHPKIQRLSIYGYKGSQLPMEWLVSPHNQLRRLVLDGHTHLTSLPPLGKLPYLEELQIGRFRGMDGLERVGGEMMGIGRRSGEEDMDHLHIIVFPKLKKLTFQGCAKWKDWEDITTKELECGSMVLMPSLIELKIIKCTSLTALPHRLLCKVSSLKCLDITDSTLLHECYSDKNGSNWKAIFQYNPRLQLFGCS